MRRVEAEKLIGKVVVSSFVNGGIYVGELLEIIPSKPFRANIRVKGLITYPTLYNHNTRPLTFNERSGINSPYGESSKLIIYKEGEIINIGNSIEVYDGEVFSYNKFLKNSIEEYLERVNNTLSRYLKDDKFSSCFIASLEDSLKLKNILLDKLQNIEA